jgi:hypothetical protein
MKTLLTMMAVSALLLTFFFTRPANAACVCQCVNGQVQAICQSAIDLRPMCSSAICPIVPPALKPIESVKLPPLGTTQCHNEQVLNPATHKYEWKRLCN